RDEAVAQLRPVGLAGGQAGTRAGLDHADGVAVLAQEIGGHHADDAGADHDDVHVQPRAPAARARNCPMVAAAEMCCRLVRTATTAGRRAASAAASAASISPLWFTA